MGNSGDQVFAQSTEPIAGHGVPEEMIWDCVTCGACVQACPVSIEHVDHIVDLRRHLVRSRWKFPAEAEPMLRDVERAVRIRGASRRRSGRRGRSSSECACSNRAIRRRKAPLRARAARRPSTSGRRRSAEATAKLLQKAGVDFAILGPRESCTGDPARRMGNEYVFQAFAEQNVSTLNESGVTKIVASCPHCFNTLANEYGDFGGNYEVLHYTELLAQLVESGRLQPKAGQRVDHLPRLVLPGHATTTCGSSRASS